MERGKDYIGVGVGAAIISPDRKILLAQRGIEAKNERFRWELPGGSVEMWETSQQTIVREIMEELGFKIEVIDIIGFWDHIILEEGQHWVSSTHLCKIVSGEPKILEPQKCAAIGWFTLKKASEQPLSGIAQHGIEKLIQLYPEGLPNLY